MPQHSNAFIMRAYLHVCVLVYQSVLFPQSIFVIVVLHAFSFGTRVEFSFTIWPNKRNFFFLFLIFVVVVVISFFLLLRRHPNGILMFCGRTFIALPVNTMPENNKHNAACGFFLSFVAVDGLKSAQLIRI